MNDIPETLCDDCLLAEGRCRLQLKDYESQTLLLALSVAERVLRNCISQVVVFKSAIEL